ncbi:MAG: amidase [Rhodospirillales bacterium]|nr:amidase [Rhodospirillales bacterium]
MTELWRLSAVETVALLKKGEVAPAELIDAAAARIEAVDGTVNALPIRCFERARGLAESARGKAPLYGLPVAIKDSMDVAGVRSTQGSPIFADHVPTRSDIQVERLEEKGALVVARSNAPEFAAGANTFNEVFGATLNPFDTRMTCGGSSGGSAVALATGMVWLANGSDLGGSLRIPASFCSVVGFRPSPGVVAQGPGAIAFDDLAVSGPMARDVGDLMLMLEAMSGEDVRDPLSIALPRREPPAKLRAGWSPDLGFLPVDPEVRAICAAAAERLAELGADVEETGPDLSGARETFQTLRALRFAAAKKDLLLEHRARLKPEVVWNIEQGLKLTADEIGRAMRERAALYQRVAAFFETHDLLLAPVVMVPPFPVERRWVEECAGVRFDNYVDWLGHTYAITLTRCPALSLPCGFTRAGLPVGLQIVGPPMSDWSLLEVARRFEAVLRIAKKVPITPSMQ